jgi:hypothetical protein
VLPDDHVTGVVNEAEVRTQAVGIDSSLQLALVLVVKLDLIKVAGDGQLGLRPHQLTAGRAVDQVLGVWDVIRIVADAGREQVSVASRRLGALGLGQVVQE